MNISSEMSITKEELLSQKVPLYEPIFIPTEYMKPVQFSENDHQELNLINHKVEEEVPAIEPNFYSQYNLLRRGTSQHIRLDNQASEKQEVGVTQVKKADLNFIEMQMFKTINKMKNIDKFQKLLFQNTRVFSKITQRDLEMINDKAYFNQQDENDKQQKGQTLFQSMQKLVGQIEAKLPILLPYQKKRVFIDIFQAVLIIFTLYIYSLLIFFQMPNTMQSVMVFMLVMFVVDTILNFNTGFFYKGNMVLVRREITKKYFKTNFLWDAMAFLSLGLTIREEDEQVQQFNAIDIIMKVLIFFKIFSLFEIFTRLEDYFYLQEQKKHIVDLIRLVCILISVIHVFGCIWHGLALYEVQYLHRGDTWLHQKEISDVKDIYTHYSYSIYFLAVTMISIGYGDITPQNPLEVTVAIGIMFITGMTFAYSINTIGNILQRLEEKKSKLKKDLSTINQLLRRESINNELRMRISNYIQYINTQQNINQRSQELEVLHQLPISLQNEMKYEISSKIVNEISFLKQHFSLPTIKKVTQLMEECWYNSGDVIFGQNEVKDYAVYYVVQGNIQITLPNQDSNKQQHVLTVLGPKAIFGELEFFTGQPRAAQANASEYCRVFKLTRENMVNILLSNQEEYQTFCQLREELIHSQMYNKIHMQCYQCQSHIHLSQYCPKTHFHPNRRNIIDRENKLTQKNRKKLNFEVERMKKKFQALSDISQIQVCVFNILENQHLDKEIETILEKLDNSDDSMSEEEEELENKDLANNSKVYVKQESIFGASKQHSDLGLPLIEEDCKSKNKQHISSSQTLQTRNSKNLGSQFEYDADAGGGGCDNNSEKETDRMQQQQQLQQQQQQQQQLQQPQQQNLLQKQSFFKKLSSDVGGCSVGGGSSSINYNDNQNESNSILKQQQEPNSLLEQQQQRHSGLGMSPLPQSKGKRAAKQRFVRNMQKKNSITPMAAQLIQQQLLAQQNQKEQQQQQQQQQQNSNPKPTIIKQKSSNSLCTKSKYRTISTFQMQTTNTQVSSLHLIYETMKEFTHFFPQFNYSVVLENLKRMMFPSKYRFQNLVQTIKQDQKKNRKSLSRFSHVFNHINQNINMNMNINMNLSQNQINTQNIGNNNGRAQINFSKTLSLHLNQYNNTPQSSNEILNIKRFDTPKDSEG